MTLKNYRKLLDIFHIGYDMFVHQEKLLIIRYKVPLLKRYHIRAFNSKGEQVYRERITKK